MGAFASAFVHALSHAFPSDGSTDPGTGDGSFTADDRAMLVSLEASVANLTAALAAITAKLVSGVVTVQSPVSEAGDSIRIVRGDNYSVLEGRSFEFTGEAWPVLDGTVVFKLGCNKSIDAAVTADRTVRVELVPADTSELQARNYRWELEATQANGHIITLVSGDIVILPDL